MKPIYKVDLNEHLPRKSRYQEEFEALREPGHCFGVPYAEIKEANLQSIARRFAKKLNIKIKIKNYKDKEMYAVIRMPDDMPKGSWKNHSVGNVVATPNIDDLFNKPDVLKES